MINLNKGNPSVFLKKVPSVGVKVQWPATTDYDLGAEILYKDGSTESLAWFPVGGESSFSNVSRNGTVILRGDAGRGVGTSEEVMSIDWDDEIQSIAPWVYSAQSNGTGSFFRHKVTTGITVGSETVAISAEDASDNDTVYTLVPGILHFNASEIQVDYLELYSDPRSEYRPAFRPLSIFNRAKFLSMNGPRNAYK